MAKGLPPPIYSMISRIGPQHAPIFTVAVTVEGYPQGTAEGRSLRAAEKSAATAFLAAQEKAPQESTE